jgi:transcriptional regulator with XRE-family HTH domain
LDPNSPACKPSTDLAVALRTLRAALDWHQADFADAAGIDVRTHQRYESGELEVSDEALERLLRAARLPASVFEHVLRPALRLVRAEIEEEREIARHDFDRPEETPEEMAERVGQEVALAAKLAFLENLRERRLEEDEREANAWRPKPADREEAADVLRRLARCDPEERSFLFTQVESFPRWALAERLAESAAEPAGHDGAGSSLAAFGTPLDRARLAVQVAGRVPGPESWKARVEGYARAFLSQALRQAGEEEPAARERDEAERLWAVGADDPGQLVEGKFLRALGRKRVGS